MDEALAELFTQLKDLGDDGKHKKVGLLEPGVPAGSFGGPREAYR